MIGCFDLFSKKIKIVNYVKDGNKLNPGTKIASFIGLVLWILIPYNLYLRISIIICTWIIGHYSILAIIKNSEEVDPPSIVIDEVIGIWISCLFIHDNMVLSFLAFILFRYFDIMKPSMFNKNYRIWV